MEETRRKYARLKFLLAEIDQKVNDLENEEHFFDVLGDLKADVEEVQVLKKELITGTKLDQQKYFQELEVQAKQIQSSFDNITRIKKLEMLAVRTKLKNLQNSKKLITYNRE